MTAVESPLERLAGLDAAERDALLTEAAAANGLTVPELKARLVLNWRFVARPKQLDPAGQWTFWFLMAGRGFGKTLTGAQWTKKQTLARRRRWALVAPTLGDVRDTMVEGETGLLSILKPEQLLGGSRKTAWNRSLLELTLANGSHLKGFSSEEPDRLRGPQHHGAWGEEVSSWKDAGLGNVLNSTFSNMTIGCRLGENPQVCLTSTPKANKLTKELVALDGGPLRLIRGSSYENRSNLSEAYWNVIVAPLEGTRTGRQEILAEVLDDVEGALWTRAQLDRLRVGPEDVPPLARVLVGVDPNVSSKQTADSAGIIVAGLEQRRDTGRLYVLADLTVTKGGPRAWAAKAVEAYHEFQADRIVAEVNNGGEMVELTIRTVDPDVSYKEVHATRGKRVRAEPVSALYEGAEGWETDPGVRQPRAHHVGAFPDLEDEMTTWLPGDESPNRMDALVWALTELGLGDSGPIPMRTHVARQRIPTGAERFGPGFG